MTGAAPTRFRSPLAATAIQAQPEVEGNTPRAKAAL
jgi:hypothetical protein